MPIPKSVLDAEDQADHLIAEMAGATPPSEDEYEEPTPEEAGEHVESEEETAEEGAGVAEDTGLASQLAELQEKFDKLQAAHDTLRGKTYAEVPRVLSENKALKEQIAALEGELSRLRTAPSAPSRSTGKASDILASLKEEVNEDIADKIQNLIDTTVAEQVAAHIQPVVGNVETLRKGALEMAQERYVRELTDRVPDWREIAANPEYGQFLQTTDEMSGSTLYDMASAALDRLDANRMSVFFRKFKEMKGTTDAPASTGAKKVVSGKSALISPKGGTIAGARVEDPNKPDYITTKQLEQFNKDRRKMSAKAEMAMEARIDRAIQNGWIVP